MLKQLIMAGGLLTAAFAVAEATPPASADVSKALKEALRVEGLYLGADGSFYELRPRRVPDFGGDGVFPLEGEEEQRLQRLRDEWIENGDGGDSLN
ncbi:MAG: hypothetical protein RJQ08_11570 [Salinisphaeraceae bacterium]